jgi:RNA polymerase sigma factor (sigma-70 family)
VLESIVEPLLKTFPSMSTSDTGPLPPQSFDELFLSTYPRLVSLLRRMLGDSGRAEELANEAFLKLHSTTLPPIARANIPGWLYRAAMNLGIDDLRARSRHVKVARQVSREASSSNQPEDGLQLLLRAETQQHVRLALSKLKPEWSQILLLRASGYSYKEIASHLDIPTTSVGTLLIRAEAGFEECYLELFGEKD